MKDIIGREAKVGDLFAYALIIGRSANMAVYELRGFNESGNVKAHKIMESYGYGGTELPAHKTSNEWQQKSFTHEWKYDPSTGKGDWHPLTEKQIADKREKALAKTSTLGMFSERAVILPKDYLNIGSTDK